MNAKKVPITKYGAKGISLFIPKLPKFDLKILENKIRLMPTIAPIQKAKATADMATAKPSIQPSPRASLASPSPIHLPEDKSQHKKNGRAIKNPVAIESIDGICQKEKIKLL